MNKSDITQNTFTTNQQIAFPTTQSNTDSIGANISTDLNVMVANTSIPHVDKPENDNSDRRDFDNATGNHIR